MLKTFFCERKRKGELLKTFLCERKRGSGRAVVKNLLVREEAVVKNLLVREEAERASC